MKQHSSQDQRCLDEQSHASKMLMPMMKSWQQIHFSQRVIGQMQPFFLWNIQYNKDAVKKRTFGSVGETAGTEIGDKWRSEGGGLVKTIGCYIEFHVKNNSTNSVKSTLHRVCTLLLYTICHVGSTKSWPRNRVRDLENEWLSNSVRGGKNGIWNLCLRLASLSCFRSNLWALERC
jgi:hypothetical protein